MPSVKLSFEQLSEVAAYDGQVIFEKQDTNVRSNPNVKPYMDLIKPAIIVVYGMMTEICVSLGIVFYWVMLDDNNMTRDEATQMILALQLGRVNGSMRIVSPNIGENLHIDGFYVELTQNQLSLNDRSYILKHSQKNGLDIRSSSNSGKTVLKVFTPNGRT